MRRVSHIPQRHLREERQRRHRVERHRQSPRPLSLAALARGTPERSAICHEPGPDTSVWTVIHQPGDLAMDGTTRLEVAP